MGSHIKKNKMKNSGTGADIKVKDLNKSYLMEDGSKLQVLDDISIQIEDEEFFSLLGRSGCGKSTVLSILAGLAEHDTGMIEMGGASVDQNREGAGPQVGVVFQDPTLLDWKTVGDNVKFALEGMEIPEEKHEGRIHSSLELVGLGDFVDQYPQSLSGGMRQRVGIARALSIDPDILLMDEPFSSLDEITARKLRNDVLDIWRREKKTILFVTHNIKEAVYLSDKVGVLSDKPASFNEIINIDISRPRDLKSPEIIEYEDQVLDALGIK